MGKTQPFHGGRRKGRHVEEMQEEANRDEQRETFSRGERAHQRGGEEPVSTDAASHSSANAPMPKYSGIVRLRLEEYKKANSRHFMNVPATRLRPVWEPLVVVEQRDGYSIVEKIGRAGEIVNELDEHGPVQLLTSGP